MNTKAPATLPTTTLATLMAVAILALAPGCSASVKLDRLEFLEDDQQYPKMMLHLASEAEGNAVQHASVTVDRVWTLKRNACFITQAANWRSDAVLPTEPTPYELDVDLPYPLSVSETTGIPLAFGNDGEPGHYYVYLVNVTLNLLPSGDDVKVGKIMFITNPPFDILGGPSPCVDGRETYVTWKKTIAGMEPHVEGSHIHPHLAVMLRQASVSNVQEVVDMLYESPDDEETVRYHIEHLSMLREVDDLAMPALEAASRAEQPLIQKIAKEILEEADVETGEPGS